MSLLLRLKSLDNKNVPFDYFSMCYKFHFNSQKLSKRRDKNILR